MIKKILFFAILWSVFACQQETSTTHSSEQKLVFKPSFEGIDAFLNYQEKISNRKDLKVLQSLLFTHKSGYTLQSKVYLDPKGEILMANQEILDTNGRKTIFTYYFLKEVLSMVQIDEQNLRLSQLQLQQTRLFYDADQRPIVAYKRTITSKSKQPAFVQTKLQKQVHAQIQLHLQWVSDMQNQEGQFSLLFQGFDEAFNKKFVQFGNAAFSSNLAYAPNEALIAQLEKNANSFANQTFSIQFQQVQEASGLQYQVLTGISKTDATN